MTTINLKDFYYWYTQDQFIEVSGEVAEVFVSDARHEMAYQRRLSRHKAQYSLDCDDGIEYSACLHEPTPQELLERMELFIRLWNALNSLPEIQGRRIDAHIILGKSIKEIAEAEGVHEESVRQSIKRGLERMKKTFLFFLYPFFPWKSKAVFPSGLSVRAFLFLSKTLSNRAKFPLPSFSRPL